MTHIETVTDLCFSKIWENYSRKTFLEFGYKPNIRRDVQSVWFRNFDEIFKEFTVQYLNLYFPNGGLAGIYLLLWF